MKTKKIISAAIVMAGIFTVGCTKEYFQIEGEGALITETLQIDDFTSIDLMGVDDVYITYGTEQKVTVTGHPNIISRISTEVSNKTWHMELEDGNYGRYELTYYLTLPSLEKVVSEGTGDVVISDFIPQENLSVSLIGSGSFLGFPLEVANCTINISGTGDCEVSVTNRLDVSIIGSGNVYYKGNPVIHEDISGSGSVLAQNN